MGMSPCPRLWIKAAHASLSPSIFIVTENTGCWAGKHVFRKPQAGCRGGQWETRERMGGEGVSWASPTHYRVSSTQHIMLQSHPIKTSFPSQDIPLQMSSKIIEMTTTTSTTTTTKIRFKYTLFVLVGKVRVYIFDMAE